MQFYEINMCQSIIFRLYAVYNKHEIIKNGKNLEKNRKSYRKCLNNFVYDCICSQHEISFGQFLLTRYPGDDSSFWMLSRITFACAFGLLCASRLVYQYKQALTYGHRCALKTSYNPLLCTLS